MAERYEKVLNAFSVSLPSTWPREPLESPPGLTGIFGITLEAGEYEFAPAVAGWLLDDRLAPLWGDYGVAASDGRDVPDKMKAILGNGVFLIIRKKDESVPLGFVCAKPTPPPRRHMNVGIFLEDQYRGFGYGPSALAVFLRYLFHNFDVPKLTFNLFGWDLSGFRAIAHLEQFRLEGIRRRHFHLKNVLHDLYEVALTREDFQALTHTPLGRRLLGPALDRADCDHEPQ